MTYCRFCGMESKKPDKCEWCGRALVQQPVQPPVRPPEPVRTTAQLVEEEEEAGRKSRVAFYITNIALLVLAAIILLIRKDLYPLVIIGGLFISGILIGYFQVIPPFDQEWVEVGVPLGLLLFFPAIIICAGYIAYGLIFRSMNLNIVWLLGTYLVMIAALETVTVLVMIKGAPASFFWKIHSVEFLGLAAIMFGWICSGLLRQDR